MVSLIKKIKAKERSLFGIIANNALIEHKSKILKTTWIRCQGFHVN